MKPVNVITPTPEQCAQFWASARLCMADSVNHLSREHGMKPVSGMGLMINYGMSALFDLDAKAAMTFLRAGIQALELRGTAAGDVAETAYADAFDQLAKAAHLHETPSGGTA